MKLKFNWNGLVVTGEYFPGRHQTYWEPEEPPEFDLHSLFIGNRVQLPEEFVDYVRDEHGEELLEAAGEKLQDEKDQHDEMRGDEMRERWRDR